MDLQSLDALGQYQLAAEPDALIVQARHWCTGQKAVLPPLRHPVFISDLDFWDYARVGELIDLGRQQTRQALQIEPVRITPQWQARIRQALVKAARKIIP